MYTIGHHWTFRLYSVQAKDTIAQFAVCTEGSLCPKRPHICHLDHLYIGGEKIGHVEKFQMSIHDECGEI